MSPSAERSGILERKMRESEEMDRACLLVSVIVWIPQTNIHQTNTTHSNTQHTLLSKSSDPSMAQETDPEQVFEILERMGEG